MLHTVSFTTVSPNLPMKYNADPRLTERKAWKEDERRLFI